MFGATCLDISFETELCWDLILIPNIYGPLGTHISEIGIKTQNILIENNMLWTQPAKAMWVFLSGSL